MYLPPKPHSRWEGWERASQFLADKLGTLWIVSPYITALLPAQMLRGAKVLTRVSAQQLADGVSSEAALRHLLDSGAEVRVCSNLHAKVYLRMHGSQAMGFSGSANLTSRGKAAGERHNYEVMTGPEEFSVGFIRELTSHWANASVLTATTLFNLSQEAERLRENMATREQVATDVVVFIVETRLLRAFFELTAYRLGVPSEERTEGFKPARVDFVTAKNRSAGNALLREGLKRLQDGRSGRAAPLQGASGLTYAVPLADRERFQDGLEELNGRVQTHMDELVSLNRQAWRDDFLKRVEEVARSYNRATSEQVAFVRECAAFRFDDYLHPEKLDIGIRYGLYLPLQVQRPLAHDFRTYFRGVREGQKLDLGELK